LPIDKVQTALRSIFKHNWRTGFAGFKQYPRTFLGEKDKGLLICTWPKGGRPKSVMCYSDEVWTGIEYQVAAHMIYEGMIEEGFAIVKGARDRYDGVPRPPIGRNPWSEIECGGHYARAMSSWSLLLAASGFRYDGTTRSLHFAPRVTPGNFKAFFSGPEGWGSLRQVREGTVQRNIIQVVEGQVVVSLLHLAPPTGVRQVKVTVSGASVEATLKHNIDATLVAFAAPAVLKTGDTLIITFS
jgi:non-lysosomal glucosylceramidase